MKVNSFFAWNNEKLDEKINEFLSSNDDIEVIDIKFSSTMFYFSSMIIYKNHNFD
ncbi:hypothetical protein [Paenisporosarcina antarctica]|uniref:hypothetical protein n=1 Tax=Paenisporosarcina antarctica TaxID=417367 RepID=UPI00141700A7|nr:hypothetical protein [Paenisporosarcina antarctica]